MKCNIAKDLVSLYAEGLCSGDTSAELEKHLEECADCKKTLEHYQTEISNEKNISEEPSKLKPMKKAAKKLKRNRVAAIILAVVLVIIFGCICVLSYGEMTYRCVSFSMISDYFRLKSVTESLAEGNTEPLVEILALDSEHYYLAPTLSNFKNPNEYRAFIKAQADNTYEKLFSGRDIDVRMSEMWYDNYDYGGEAWFYYDYFPLYISFEFCEGDNVIHTMQFRKLGHGKFEAYEYSSDMNNEEISFVGNVLPSDEIIIELTMRSMIRIKYQEIAVDKAETNRKCNWYIFVNGIYGGDNTDYTDRFKERITEMYKGNVIPKEVMYGINRFDDEKGLWVYSVWVEYEELDTGKSFVVNYDFLYNNSKFYVDPEREPYVVSSDVEIDSAVSEMVMNIFTG